AAPAPTESELRAKESEALRQKALQAHSEAERLVSEEHVRLLGVERAQADFAQGLARQSSAIADRRDITLGWQRRAREARGKDPAVVDRTYGDLRVALRSARDDLSRTLDDLVSKASSVPEPGPDPLADLQTTVDTQSAQETRNRVKAEAGRLLLEEVHVREESASQLLDEIDTLNGERLALLPFLTSEKRDAITSFGPAGLDQGASEARQLTLITRYHRFAAGEWVASLRRSDHGLIKEVGRNLFLLIEGIAAIAAFFWLRRRIPPFLEAMHGRAVASDRQERLSSPSPATRIFAFAMKVQKPIEWLALAIALSWLLPSTTKDVLEVQLVTVIVEWVLVGALVVDVVNALAGSTRPGGERHDVTAVLRLRSLRLVGRVVVAFGLILVLSARLVGRGTIHEWVLSTCWLASFPLVLVLVRWWRDIVFDRVERTRKKSPFETWMLANRTGWKSFVAATAGGAYLFVRGASRAARSWVSRFDVTRRLLAYLFRRELDKLGAERADAATHPILPSAFEALGPDAPSAEWISTDLDSELEALTKRLREQRGGVIAVVGRRGMGKSTLLRRLNALLPDTLLLVAPADGEANALRAELADRLHLAPDTSLDAASAALATSGAERALLLDDAHRFVRPVMGGLAAFDTLLATASRHSSKTTWVFALDEVIWLFLQRARGARPLFDHVVHLRPWREEEIISLLKARTENVGLEPSFERLLDKLPPNADEIDKQEALVGRASSYYRLLWDYAAGNPGVALHMWRRSLGKGDDGVTHVGFFQALDTMDFESLPDPAVFVLRAVLQLAPAKPEEIARATMLNAADVADALRYALSRGYLEEHDGRYTVAWTWFRAMSLFLERRHLLVAP
ncbi:MAG: ATP-binding protein, partial [Polyangiaceae bacterium]